MEYLQFFRSATDAEQPPYFSHLSHEIPKKNQLIKPSNGISLRYFLANRSMKLWKWPFRSIKIIGKSLLITPWFSPFHPPNIHKSIPFQPQITLISLMTQQGLRFRRRLRSPEARLRATTKTLRKPGKTGKHGGEKLWKLGNLSEKTRTKTLDTWETMGNMEKPRKFVRKQLRQTRFQHIGKMGIQQDMDGKWWDLPNHEDFTNHFCGDFMTIWGHDVQFFMAQNMAKSRWFTGKSSVFRGNIAFFHGKIIRSLGSQATVEGVRELGDMAAALSAICLGLGHRVEVLVYWRLNQLFGSCRCFLCISYMDIYGINYMGVWCISCMVYIYNII